MLASQLDLAAYAVEDSVVLEEVDTGNAPAVTQPEADDNDGEKNEQNPDGDDSPEEGNKGEDTSDIEEEERETGDENTDEEAGGIQETVEVLTDVEPEKTEEVMLEVGSCFGDRQLDLEYRVIDAKRRFVEVISISDQKAKDSIKIPDKAIYYYFQEEIPYTVTKIADSCFLRCKQLTGIEIPDSVVEIGKEAFALSGLEEITIPNSVTTIGDNAFSTCSSLKHVTMPTGITRISNGMFDRCEVLNDVTIPSKVEFIGAYAFHECNSLEKIVIPSAVKEIGVRAFGQCNNLTNVSMDKGIETIGNEAFMICPRIEELVIPDSVTFIGEYAFYGCSSLGKIKLSSGMTEICEDAFCSCSSLTNVSIPQGITSIGKQAFRYCEKLSSITIPASVTYVDYCAFDNCGLDELRIAVTIVKENGQKKVTPIALCEGSESSCFSPKRRWESPIIFLSADGQSILTGDDFDAAREAYLAVDDGNTQDDRWWEWRSVKAYSITASSGEGGTITPNGDVFVAEGDNKIFTITPNESYRLKSIVVDGTEVKADGESEAIAQDAVTAKTYTFTGVRDNHTIAVSFEASFGGDTPGDDTPPGGGDKPSGGGGDSGSNENGSTSNTDNTSAPAAEMVETVVDGSVQAAPAVVMEEEAPAAQNGQNQAAADTQGKEPKTGDSSRMEIYATIAMIAGLTYMLLYFMEERRGMTEREKEVFVAAFIRWAKKGGTFRKCCALVAIFCILAYYHSVGKRNEGQICPAQN